MIVETEDHQPVTVGWRYDLGEDGRKVTICYLKRGKGEQAVRLAEGKAVCHVEDQFCKNCGRKRAMHRALKNYTEGLRLGRNEGKAVRRAFWESYAAMRHGSYL